MKQLIIIIGIFLSLNGFCQNSRKVYFKINYGPSLSIPSLKTYETSTSDTTSLLTKYEANIGCFLDLFIDIKLNKNYSLTTGAGYLFNHYNIYDKTGYEERTGHLTHSDINVPLVLNSRFKNCPVIFSIGPYLSFKIFANESGTRSIDTSKLVGQDSNGNPVYGYYLGIEPEQKYNYNVVNSYKKVDFGLTGQIVYDFFLSIKWGSKAVNCLVFTRFNLGLMDTYAIDNAYKWRDYNFQIGTGFRL